MKIVICFSKALTCFITSSCTMYHIFSCKHIVPLECDLSHLIYLIPTQAMNISLVQKHPSWFYSVLFWQVDFQRMKYQNWVTIVARPKYQDHMAAIYWLAIQKRDTRPSEEMKRKDIRHRRRKCFIGFIYISFVYMKKTKQYL